MTGTEIPGLLVLTYQYVTVVLKNILHIPQKHFHQRQN